MTPGAWTFAGVVVTFLLAPTWMAWWNSRVAKREVRSNGGSSLRDAVDRVKTTVDAHHHEVIARLDHGAAVMADHSDRIAVLEHRVNKGDQ